MTSSTQVDQTYQAARRDALAGKWQEAARKCLAVLRQQPANAQAIALYGEVAIRMDRLPEAIVIFKKLLAIDPQNASAQDRLAHLHHQLGDHSAAKSHAETAIRLNPKAIQSYVVLGNSLLESGQQSDAEAAFAQARQQAPDSLAVELPYIDFLLNAGKFDSALTHIRQLLDTHPACADLYQRLAISQKLDPDSDDAARLETLADASGEICDTFRTSKDNEAAACYAIYALRSTQQRYDEAFRFLENANTLRKSAVPESAGADTSVFRRVTALFDRAFINAREGTGTDSRAPIFIVGMPRSGTTLLEQTLAQHPDVQAAGELPFIASIIQEVCAKTGSSQNDLESLARLPASAWTQMGNEYLRRVRERVPAGRFFVDKMPGNFMHLGIIRLMLPKATILHSVRDPMATCLSIYEQDFGGAHPYACDLNWLGLHYVAYEQLMAHWQTLFGDDIHTVNYESLVTSPDENRDRLLGIIGLSGYDVSTGATHATGMVRTASRWQARQPTHTNSIARWRNFEQQLKPLQDLIGPSGA
tara:strand:- start:468111 stop:469706 length:1596 start_codon:yes stop_codon:yes gene_type:complete